MPPDPILQFRRWYAAAERTGAPLPEAIALATADRRGRPSVRFVLLKHVDARGFVFFTDGRSRKGAELATNLEAAFAVSLASSPTSPSFTSRCSSDSPAKPSRG